MSEVARAAVSPVGSRSPRYRVGLDIGGTFTDFILLDCATDAVRLHKCLTTPGRGRARRVDRAGR